MFAPENNNCKHVAPPANPPPPPPADLDESMDDQPDFSFNLELSRTHHHHYEAQFDVDPLAVVTIVGKSGKGVDTMSNGTYHYSYKITAPNSVREKLLQWKTVLTMFEKILLK